MQTCNEVIKEKIIEQLNRDARVYASDISVQFSENVVKLTGTVPSHAARRVAMDIAMNIDGVLDVNNHVVIVPTQMIADELVGQGIIRALERRIGADASNLKVKVENGQATLSGTLPNNSTYIAARNAVWRTAGVTQVICDINIE